MEPSYKIISYNDFKQMVTDVKVISFREKTLNQGIMMKWYIPLRVRDQYIVISETVYAFEALSAALIFFNSTQSAPMGTVKHEYKVNTAALNDTANMNYNLMSYDFFERRKLKGYAGLKTLSEIKLNDGRLSVLYGRNRTNGVWAYWDCFLVIGKMVFSDSGIERLKRLENDINNGSATYWRPELAGTMDYVPKYSVSDFDKCRHMKFVKEYQFQKRYEMPGGTIADLYKRQDKTTRYYIRWLDKL